MKRTDFLKQILGRGEPIERIDLVLQELSSMLHGRNYSVFLRRYTVPFIPGATTEQYVIAALPDAIVGGVEPVSIVDMVAEVEGSLRHTGDSGYGPKKRSLESPEFATLLEETLSWLRSIASESTGVVSVWFEKGHPAYPVFWDFAFIITTPSAVEIVIGSSSD